MKTLGHTTGVERNFVPLTTCVDDIVANEQNHSEFDFVMGLAGSLGLSLV